MSGPLGMDETPILVNKAMAAQPMGANPDGSKTFQLTVLHADKGTPVADAEIVIRLSGKGLRVRETLRTDHNGQIAFPYPTVPATASMYVVIRHAGLVPYQVSFGHGLTIGSLPLEKVVRLESGKRIGGIVVDSEGNPLVGADVAIRVPVTESLQQHYVFNLLKNGKTDERGRWQLDGAPKPVSSLTLVIDHPGFLRTGIRVKDAAEAQYRLDRGWSIRGTVRDPAGQPVKGAVVHPGTDRWGSGKPEAWTNADGQYTLSGLVQVDDADRYGTAPGTDDPECRLCRGPRHNGF